jgi:hypothetical protein
MKSINTAKRDDYFSMWTKLEFVTVWQWRLVRLQSIIAEIGLSTAGNYNMAEWRTY